MFCKKKKKRKSDEWLVYAHDLGFYLLLLSQVFSVPLELHQTRSVIYVYMYYKCCTDNRKYLWACLLIMFLMMFLLACSGRSQGPVWPEVLIWDFCWVTGVFFKASNLFSEKMLLSTKKAQETDYHTSYICTAHTPAHKIFTYICERLIHFLMLTHWYQEITNLSKLNSFVSCILWSFLIHVNVKAHLRYFPRVKHTHIY